MIMFAEFDPGECSGSFPCGRSAGSLLQAAWGDTTQSDSVAATMGTTTIPMQAAQVHFFQIVGIYQIPFFPRGCRSSLSDSAHGKHFIRFAQ
jgi:hypothetical protein